MPQIPASPANIYTSLEAAVKAVESAFAASQAAKAAFDSAANAHEKAKRDAAELYRKLQESLQHIEPAGGVNHRP